MSFFLCLSAVMVITAIVRMSKIFDVIWQALWQTLEGCVALLMTSITAFRTIFVSQEIRDRQKHWAPSRYWLQREMERKTSKESDVERSGQIPSIPLATFDKMKRAFRGHLLTTAGRTTTDSEIFSTEREDETPLSVGSRQ